VNLLIRAPRIAALLVLAGWTTSVFAQPQASAPAQAQAQAQAQAPVQGRARTEAATSAPQGGAIDPVRAARLRDPMQAPAHAPAPETAADTQAGTADAGPGLQLASIRRAGNAPARALIDGKWLAVGATVGEWRIRAIGADDVLLQSLADAHDTRRLMLHQLSIRRLATSTR
jgi:hypothetical protein